MANDKRKLPKRENDFAGWYQEVVARAELAEHAPVKGCMVMRPYGYAVWENIHDELNRRIKLHGASNVNFPIFIPESYLAREKDHIEGFSPEVAVVTYAGGEELAERLIVRPTSETIIHDSMRRWIQSYNDLPLKINQWGNAVRWEKHPRLFLRTSEFQWQEGHTAHATEAEAREEVDTILHLYHQFCEEVLALPTVMGRKSEKEKFAGAVESYSIEGMMPDGRALQMGTVHYLGENFSRMANVSFMDNDNTIKFVQMTSWGVSTRLIGALIMVHGDDKGLIMPPVVAPVQVIIVPVSEEANAYAMKLMSLLRDAGIRTELDLRANVRVGAKYYDSELRGIPLRIELGQKEVENETFTLALRHDETKVTLPFMPASYVDGIKEYLKAVQADMLERAKQKLSKQIVAATNKEDFAKSIKELKGFVSAPWCDEMECELTIKEATGAVTRNMPLHAQQRLESGDDCNCIWCGRPARRVAYFARAY